MGLAQHLEKLPAFVVIADTGKMSEAAKILNITQPSLTRLVDTLEVAIGSKIFLRGRNGSSLTAAGTELYNYAQSVLNPICDLEERIKHPKEIDCGHLNIGSYESLAEYLWPDFLIKFKRKFPNLKLSIKTARGYDLDSGKIDLIVDAEPRIVGDVDSYPLFSDSFGFFYNGKIFKPSQVEQLPVIYVPTAFDSENRSLESYITTSQFSRNETIELDSFTSVRSFCERGLGLAILPNRLAKSSLNKNSIVRIKVDGFPLKFGKHGIFVTIKTSRQSDPRINLLIKELKHLFKQH